jgi:LysM repeat protein
LIVTAIVVYVLPFNWSFGNRGRPGPAALALAIRPPTATVTPTPNPTYTPTATATASPTATPTPRVHYIQGGETLSYIAELYRVPLPELMQLNNVEAQTILRVGQALTLPSEALLDTDLSDNFRPQIVYVIEEGDTLSDIAFRYGTTVSAITLINPEINLDLIFPGQGIVIPLATPTPTPTATVTPTPTFTPRPPYESPSLLNPIPFQVVNEPYLLFTWTATTILADNEFYVLYLAWPDGSFSEQWTQQSSWRLSKADRRAAGTILWRVAILRQTGTTPTGTPTGLTLADSIEQRTVVWP